MQTTNPITEDTNAAALILLMPPEDADPQRSCSKKLIQWEIAMTFMTYKAKQPLASPAVVHVVSCIYTMRPLKSNDSLNMAITLLAFSIRRKGSIGSLGEILQVCYNNAKLGKGPPGPRSRAYIVAHFKGILSWAIYGSFVTRDGEETDPAVLRETTRAYKPWLLHV